MTSWHGHPCLITGPLHRNKQRILCHMRGNNVYKCTFIACRLSVLEYLHRALHELVCIYVYVCKLLCPHLPVCVRHYSDVIMSPMASQITSLTIAYSAVYSGADQRKHQSSVSLAFLRGIHRSPVNSQHKWPAMRKCFHLITSSCICLIINRTIRDICDYQLQRLVLWKEIRENVAGPLWGESTSHGWITPQRASNAESVSMAWRCPWASSHEAPRHVLHTCPHIQWRCSWIAFHGHVIFIAVTYGLGYLYNTGENLAQ